jgi:hypothetical protein
MRLHAVRQNIRGHAWLSFESVNLHAYPRQLKDSESEETDVRREALKRPKPAVEALLDLTL